MVSKHLDRINREVERIWKSNGGAECWDVHALDSLNAGFHGLIAETAGQLEEWNVELGAREELQQRILSALPESDRIKELWWNEQRAFYTDLLERMDTYFNYDDTAVVTFSINALEILFLVRLLIEEGVLQTETLQPVFRYLSRYGHTERYSKLSFDSLKKRYSLRHDGSRKKVKQILTNMIKRIDQGPPRG
ncbi:hypothetical protein [Parapedobacter koreensis]|uniref:Uncharacterized protein n=1 Tax=Parapedobacter koreensis TaxID=332977 RepID=A0A1H7NL79_9SPHI|nr:hypothetical protein [Parapedobacter koreensis]SEL24144.1 hypothetical protein SAMN05421740_10425 [Parapedobacter koreensis]